MLSESSSRMSSPERTIKGRRAGIIFKNQRFNPSKARAADRSGNSSMDIVIAVKKRRVIYFMSFFCILSTKASRIIVY